MWYNLVNSFMAVFGCHGRYWWYTPTARTDLNALALDLFGCGVYAFPHGAAGALSFHDPLEGTEIKKFMTQKMGGIASLIIDALILLV